MEGAADLYKIRGHYFPSPLAALELLPELFTS